MARGLRRSPSGPFVTLSEVFPSARFSLAAPFTVVLGTATTVVFDTIDYDTGGFVDEASPLDGFTVSETGFYLIGGFTPIDAFVNENVFLNVVNTTGPVVALSGPLIGSGSVDSSGAFLSGVVPATAGDKLELVVVISDTVPGSRDIVAPANFFITQMA